MSDPADRLAGLLRDVVRDVRHGDAVLGDSGLPASTAAILGLLTAEGPVRSGRLAALLGVDASVVSRQVAAAQSAGLVERRPDPHDGRACLLALTDEGAGRLAEHRALRATWLSKVLAAWSDDDVAALTDGLTRLRDDARAVLPSASRAGRGARPSASLAVAG